MFRAPVMWAVHVGNDIKRCEAFSRAGGRLDLPPLRQMVIDVRPLFSPPQLSSLVAESSRVVAAVTVAEEFATVDDLYS